MSRKTVSNNPLVVDPEDYDPLFDDVYQDEQDLRDERGAFERLTTGVKWRKPAIHDDF